MFKTAHLFKGEMVVYEQRPDVLTLGKAENRQPAEYTEYTLAVIIESFNDFFAIGHLLTGKAVVSLV